jgi:hypothetical protein
MISREESGPLGDHVWVTSYPEVTLVGTKLHAPTQILVRDAFGV